MPPIERYVFPDLGLVAARDGLCARVERDILAPNADPRDTRYGVLTPAQVSDIEALVRIVRENAQ